MLHIINHSPIEPSLLGRISAGDAVLLIENAVYSVKRNSRVAERFEKAMGQMRVLALGSDLEARGIGPDEIIPRVEVIDYSGFVDLTVEHSVVQSW